MIISGLKEALFYTKLAFLSFELQDLLSTWLLTIFFIHKLVYD